MVIRGKIIYPLLILLATLSLSGCWDLKEIEDRGYVLGIALDSYEDLKEDLSPIEQMVPETGPKKYVMTLQIPIWKIGQAKEGGGEQKGTWDVSVAGRSLMEMNREFATRLGFPPFYEDLKVFIISRSIAEKDVIQWADFPLRDGEFRRPVQLFVAKSTLAKDILSVKPKIESYASDYLYHLSPNIFKTSRIPARLNLGDFSGAIMTKSDFAIPLVDRVGAELKDAGAAVIKKDKMVGELTERETEGLNILRNKYGGGTVVFPCWQHKDNIITTELANVKSKIKPVIKENQVEFDIETKMSAVISEISCALKHDEFSKDFEDHIEKEIGEHIKGEMMDAVKKLQELKADAAGLSGKVRVKEYKYWKANKEKWSDEIFPKARFNIKVKAKVESEGLSK